MELARRRTCCMCTSNISSLLTISRIPVFASTVDSPLNMDLFADQEWGECTSCKTIQLESLVPLDILYGGNHNSEIVGQLWEKHHKKFADFIARHKCQQIIEVGGSHGYLAKLILEENINVDYSVIEPNPGELYPGKVKIIRGFVEDHLDELKGKSAIMSHVLEHIYEPNLFLASIAERVHLGDMVFFSTPQIENWLSIGSANSLNFEHTYLLDMGQVTEILDSFGFTLIDSDSFDNHSFFHAYKRVSESAIHESLYDPTSKSILFFDYVKNAEDFSKQINSRLPQSQGPVFLFGASLFSQFLLAWGLNYEHIFGIIDNAKNKFGQRLYGTDLLVMNIDDLRSISNPTVILKMGPYQDEIRRQIHEINPSAQIWE